VSRHGVRALLAVLAVVGALISAYLTWVYLQGIAPVCVGDSSSCETVQTSRYAEILGVPVASLGVLAYAGLLGSALIQDERAALFGLFVALVGTLFTAYLTYLELFVIQAICQWCVANAALMVASLPLAALRVGRAAK
jgi:uncharacterized membrane protein